MVFLGYENLPQSSCFGVYWPAEWRVNCSGSWCLLWLFVKLFHSSQDVRGQNVWKLGFLENQSNTLNSWINLTKWTRKRRNVNTATPRQRYRSLDWPELPNKAVPAARMGERAFWEVSAPVRSTSPAGAVNTMNASGIVVLFHMENGFRKDVRTADVDMDFCIASHMFSAKTVMTLRKFGGTGRAPSEHCRLQLSCSLLLFYTACCKWVFLKG